MNPQELAKQNVAQSFGVSTITPEQQRAFDTVKSAFTPTQAPVIDLAKNQVPFDVQQPQPVQASPFIQGLTSTMDTIKNELATSQQGIDQEQQFFNQILGQLSPENQMQQFQTLQQNQGIPELQKQMSELNNIFNQRKVAYEKAIIGEEGLGSFAQAPILGRQNKLEVQASRELAPISASIQALNGQYELAQETVNQMFNIQQNSLNQQLEVRRDFLQRNYDKFDQAQKRQADTELLLLQAKQDENDTLIATQKAGATLAIEAQRRGANPMQVAQFIQRGGTEQEALSVFGNVLAQRTEEENLALKEQGLRNSLLSSQIEGQNIDNETAQTKLNLTVNGENLTPISASPQEVAVYQQTYSDIDTILRDNKLNKAVGVVRPPIKSSEYRDFTNAVDSLTLNLTLENLINAKARGATFGALSDSEIKFLSASASKINQARRTDKGGDTKGYAMTEGAFKAEMDRINNLSKIDAIRRGVDPATIGVEVTPEGYYSQDSDNIFRKLNI